MFSSEENVLLDGVDFSLDGQQVLRKISLRIGRGEGVSLVGANGSGKSTLGRIISGIVAPSAGRVLVRGSVGVVAQTPANQLITDEVIEEVAFGPACSGRDANEVNRRVQGEILRLDLQDLAGSDPRDLSGGEQQRVVIASMLACQSPVLVLDEPTAYLDSASRIRVRSIARALVDNGYTVVWISQLPEELTMFERVIVLDAGRVAWDGSSRTLEESPELMDSFGLKLSQQSLFLSRLARRGVDVGWVTTN